MPHRGGLGCDLYEHLTKEAGHLFPFGAVQEDSLMFLQLVNFCLSV